MTDNNISPADVETIYSMCDLDKQTLCGLYQPFGSHAVEIYEFLLDLGLVNRSGELTSKGMRIRTELQKKEAYRPKNIIYYDKPCDTE